MRQLERRAPFALEDWIVEPEFHQLSQGDIRRRIEPKVMEVLLKLAAHPLHVVSKDEILHAVWPDTFVGEDALTRCISVLRHALEDDPRHPRFIKTVSKGGYCLLVTARPVVLAADAIPTTHEAPAVEEATLPHTAAIDDALTLVVNPPLIARKVPTIRIAVGALLVLIAAALALWAVHEFRPRTSPPTIPTFQLTTNAGEQSRPALSPDGKQLAFVWAKEDGSHQHIYIKQIGSESLHPLTDLPEDEYSPVWSPDGHQVGFLASSQSGLALYIASASGTQPLRKIYIPGETTRWEQGALAWSPDGKSFVLADHLGAEPSSSIYRIDLDTLRSQALTKPPSGWEGDLSPVFSPDGARIAFLRASESSVADIYWIASSGGGEPHQVTHDGKMINGIAWSSDNQSIIFSSNRAGEYALSKVSLGGGTPQRLPVGTEDATQPAVSRNGSSLVFVQGSAIFGVLKVTGPKDDAHRAKEPLIVSSTAQDSAPSLSPDGTQFAFQSWRSGTQQIWVSSLTGETLRRVTPIDADLSGSGSPAWSPDGDRILFDSRIAGHSHIFSIASAGGSPTQITFGEVNDIVPRWSADRRSIYFRSNRGSRWQLWKMPAIGGTPQPVTTDDGMVGQESPDGHWLYFARGGESGIWRMPVSGGEATRILDQPVAGYWAYWAVTRNGIFFLEQKHDDVTISLYDPATEKTTTFARLDRLPPSFSGLSVLPDGKGILISEKHDAGSHISIAQGVF